MALPRLVEAFQDEGCFTLDEATGVTGRDREATRKEIEYLRSQDYLRSVRKGLYALDPDRVGSGPDPYLLAAKVIRPYLLGYHTGLELHGVSQSAFYDTVYVLAPRRFQPFRHGDLEFRHVTQDVDAVEFATVEVKRSGRDVRTAGRELALVQCADRPKYAGGFEEVVESVGGFPYLNWDRLLRILETYGKTVLYRKVGFLVDHHAERWEPPEDVLDELQAGLGSGTTYFGVEPNRGGRLAGDWQVIVPPSWEETTRG